MERVTGASLAELGRHDEAAVRRWLPAVGAALGFPGKSPEYTGMLQRRKGPPHSFFPRAAAAGSRLPWLIARYRSRRGASTIRYSSI